MFKNKAGRILGIAMVVAGLTGIVAYDLAASSVDGKVTAVNASMNQITVETPSGATMVIVSDPQTMIMSGSDSRRLADVRVGDRVKVNYTAAGNLNTATDIDIVTVTVPSGSTDAAYDRTAPDRPATDPAYDRAPDTPTDVAQNSPSSYDSTAYDRDDQLPRTASSLPLVALSGLLLVGLGIGVRVFRFLIS